MGLFVSNLVHGVLNGVELELVYNFFIACSIAGISQVEVQHRFKVRISKGCYFGFALQFVFIITLCDFFNCRFTRTFITHFVFLFSNPFVHFCNVMLTSICQFR